MTTPRIRVGATQLEVIRLGLSERDRAVLATLATFKLATTPQLRRLHFADTPSLKSAAWASGQVLRKLRHLGLIDVLSRRIGGQASGSSVAVWRLTSAGRRLMKPPDRNLPRIGHGEISLFTLEHTLTITEVAVKLREAERTGACEIIECDPEPASWRAYLNAGGGLVTLKPDMFAVTAVSGAEFEDVWFIEVDRATESLPTIQRKASQYEAYRRTGKEQAAQGVFPKVLWLTPTAKRAKQIANALAKTNGVHHAATPLDRIIEILTAK